MNRVKLASISLVIILVLSGIFTFTQTYPVAAESENRKGLPKEVATMIINKISNRIDSILTLAENYNIEIPENLTVFVDKAKEILTNASDLVEESPLSAIKLAVRASGVFAPVARYVLSSLPDDVKHDLMNDRLEVAVDVKLRMVEGLEKTVEWLENRSITVPDDIKGMISDARSVLENAKNLLETGDYEESEIAHMIAEASKLIGQATAALHRLARKGWVMASLADRAVIGMILASQKINIILNRTVNTLEDGDIAAAKTTLTDLINATDRLIDFINRAINVSGNYSDSDGEFTSTLIVLRDALIEARGYMEQALNALEEEDVFSAISYLEDAMNVLSKAITSIEPIFRNVHHFLVKMKGVFENIKNRYRDVLRNMSIHRLTNVITGIEMMKMRLKKAYYQYNQGHMSAEDFLSLLDNAENTLTRILDNLNEMPRPPAMLVQKINNLLSWIGQVRAEISG